MVLKVEFKDRLEFKEYLKSITLEIREGRKNNQSRDLESKMFRHHCLDSLQTDELRRRFVPGIHKLFHLSPGQLVL